MLYSGGLPSIFTMNDCTIACIYYVILIENILLLLCCFLTDALVVAVKKDTTISMALVGMFFFGIRIFLQAIEIPFLMRFGANGGGAC